nr:MAG TPA: hypothetical protein [Caudoviricetes sp.]
MFIMLNYAHKTTKSFIFVPKTAIFRKWII